MENKPLEGAGADGLQLRFQACSLGLLSKGNNLGRRQARLVSLDDLDRALQSAAIYRQSVPGQFNQPLQAVTWCAGIGGHLRSRCAI